VEQPEKQHVKSSTANPVVSKTRSKTPMVLIFLLSLAPVLAAVIVYFNPQWRPEGSVNYGQLVEPQRPMPVAADLQLTTLDGKPFDLNSLKGKWLLVAADGAACPDSCARKLFILRNSHASQGKNVERLARVWFITDDAPVPEKVLEAYKGTTMVRVKPEQLQKFLTTMGVKASTASEALAEPMWIIDPNGNLILQYPTDAEPEKVRKDISKLVYNSRIG
jgi:cytochrome oxidase Cu insertion factor (SCO1/SenC/PrrC family)